MTQITYFWSKFSPAAINRLMSVIHIENMCNNIYFFLHTVPLNIGGKGRTFEPGPPPVIATHANVYCKDAGHCVKFWKIGRISGTECILQYCLSRYQGSSGAVELNCTNCLACSLTSCIKEIWWHANYTSWICDVKSMKNAENSHNFIQTPSEIDDFTG